MVEILLLVYIIKILFEMVQIEMVELDDGPMGLGRGSKTSSPFLGHLDEWMEAQQRCVRCIRLKRCTVEV